MAVRYFISLPRPDAARGPDPAFSFTAVGAEGFAEQLQAALRSDALFQRWRAAQADPDEVNPSLGVVDPAAQVTGAQRDLHVELVVTSSIPSDVLKHRLRLMAGSQWTLRDVTPA